MKNSPDSPGDSELTASEMRDALSTMEQRSNDIWAILKEPSISEERRLELKNELDSIFIQRNDLKATCTHPYTDMSTGGGVFCSICDAMIGNH